MKREMSVEAKLRELAKRVNCDEVLLGVLCPRCHTDGAGCLRAWALKAEWPEQVVVRAPLFSERKMFTPRELHQVVKDAKTPLVALLAELVLAVEEHDNRYDQGLSDHHETVEKARAIVKAENLVCEKCATVLTNDSGALGVCSKCGTLQALID